MTPQEFFYLTARVREAQKSYFKTRSPNDLRYCRALENQLDFEIARVKAIVQEKAQDP